MVVEIREVVMKEVEEMAGVEKVVVTIPFELLQIYQRCCFQM